MIELFLVIIAFYFLMKVIDFFDGSTGEKSPSTYNTDSNRSNTSHSPPSEPNSNSPKDTNTGSKDLLVNRPETIPFNKFEHVYKFGRTYTIDNFQVSAYTTYYPVRYSNVPNSVKNDRQLVYDFKEGKGGTSKAYMISSCLFNQKQSTTFEPDTMISVIPASTNHKNIIRFYGFCIEMSRLLKIENGFEAIKRVEDRLDMQKAGHNIDRLVGLSFDSQLIRNKNIILFDDVITKGSSFLENAKKLKNLGAKNVIGVFLAKTYNSKTDPKPYWM